MTDYSRDPALDGAEPKDPDGAYLTHAARTFSTTEARTWSSDENIQNKLALVGRSPGLSSASLRDSFLQSKGSHTPSKALVICGFREEPTLLHLSKIDSKLLTLLV